MISVTCSGLPWCDRIVFTIVIAISVIPVLPPSIAGETSTRPVTSEIVGALIKTERASTARLNELEASGINTVVLMLDGSDDKSKQAMHAAIANAERADLAFAYWVEVARSPELADKHPQWMASLQTHDEWRRFFPNTPRPKINEVVKTYPWVPILSREPFKAHQERVLAFLANLPPPRIIFLNDLQGAPSACGCGNPLCRWTSDYGERRTTNPLGDDAAALFVKAVQAASPSAEVIPVWTTECEEHDGSADGLCAGVGCFNGICWKAYTRQLMPLAVVSEHLAVLALYKEFQRDIPHYGAAEASWVEFAIKSFETMPPQHNGTAIPVSRLIAILQGWDVSSEETEAQLAAAKKAGVKGYVVAYDKIDQSWSPKIVCWK